MVVDMQFSNCLQSTHLKYYLQPFEFTKILRLTMFKNQAGRACRHHYYPMIILIICVIINKLQSHYCALLTSISSLTYVL